MPLQSVLFFAASTFAVLSTFGNCGATEPTGAASDGIIHVRLSGRLQTVWDTDKEGNSQLHFATVEAGGAKIVVDSNNCPRITSELLDFQNEIGGGFVAEIRAEISGEMVFKPFAETEEGKRKGTIVRKLPGDALVPVVRVETLKIRVLPIIPPSNHVNRDRDTVTSTTTGIDK